MEVLQRKDQKVEFTWNFQDMFQSDEDWEKAYLELEKKMEEIPTLQGTLGKSKESLKYALDLLQTIGQKFELVYIYSMLRLNVDNGDAKYQAMNGKASMLAVKFSTIASFISPEILSIAQDTLQEWMNDESMKMYKHMLEDTNRQRAYTKDEQTEKLLAMLSDATSTPDNTFTMFESVDMRFPNIHDEEGNEVPLTHGSFGTFRESRDQKVRKEAFDVYFGEFKKYINTLAATYTGSVKTDNFYTNARGYASACEKALFQDNAPISVYDKLIEAVHNGLPIMKRYLELRKKALGLSELNMYDLYCPMVKDVEMKISYEEAKTLVKEATKPLGEEYQKLLDRAFHERWIDVYENQGKTTGAYSCGVYGAHPYVLLNFAGGFDDAFTLAHELGHCMHSYFSNTKQDFANHDYAIMVAEVASTVNEVLLTKYLLQKEQDVSKRAYILNHYLEGFRTTVFRQTLFAEFERKAHELDQNGTPLTAEVLNSVYRELNEQYYEGAIINELQDIEWARIPHFYNAFYVYQYATGFCSAVSIAKKILEENGAENYLKFLSTGGSDYPLEELKITGVDLTKPDTVASAMREFDSALKELEKILN